MNLAHRMQPFPFILLSNIEPIWMVSLKTHYSHDPLLMLFVVAVCSTTLSSKADDIGSVEFFQRRLQPTSADAKGCMPTAIGSWLPRYRERIIIIPETTLLSLGKE